MANQTLANLWIATFSLLAFAGFLRFDDAIQLWACDLQITSDMVKIAIHSSKMDQFRQGSNILITRTNSDIYPVAMLEWYMAAGEINQTSELCLFIGLAKTKDDKKLCPSGSVYYSTMRDLFRKKLEALRNSASGFGIHSFRAGGASAAAKKSVPDCLFKQHRRWKSDAAKIVMWRFSQKPAVHNQKHRHLISISFVYGVCMCLSVYGCLLPVN